MKCDFCSDPAPAWVFPAQSFQYRGTGSRGDWLACDECADCIQRGAWPQLARRSLRAPKLAMAASLIGEAAVIAETSALHRLFAKHRRGPAVPYVADSGTMQ